jgi:SAM-dependent methyltransferase
MVLRSASGGFDCGGCGRHYSNKASIPDFIVSATNREILEFYERQAQAIDQAGERSISVGYVTPANQIVHTKAVRRLMGARPKGLRILDLGCGHGSLSAELIPDNQVVGVDIARPMLAHAKARGLDVYLGDASNLPFADSSFDLVLAGQIVQHVPDASVLAAETLRVLKPGGQVFLTGPNSTSVIRKLLALMRGVGLRPRYWTDSPPRLRSRGEYAEAIKRAGGAIRAQVGQTFPLSTVIGLPQHRSWLELLVIDLGFRFGHRT